MITHLKLAALSILLIWTSTARPAWSESIEYLKPPVSRTYKIGETGHITKLGVEVEITPQATGRGGVSGFLVQADYRDPLDRSGETISLLHSTILAASCEPRFRSQDHGPYSRTNGRGTRFTLVLHQGCKDSDLGFPVPYLEAKIFCSDLPKEQRYLEAITTHRIFDIVPTGVYEKVENDVGKLATASKEIYDLYSEGSSIISDVAIVLSFLAVLEGTVTVGAFILESMEDWAIGKLKSVVVESTFEYVHSTLGMEVQFKLTGYDVTCRICGRHFHLQSIVEGDRLRCPNGDSEAIIHLH